MRINWLLLGLLIALPASAQLKVGDNLSLNLNGTLGAGYSADSGSGLPSEHALDLSANGQLDGYYFNPKFLTFTVTPYYNRSQENSGAGSITNATSISIGTGIFGGSRFPGSISWGKTFNSSSTYGLPGVQGFATHGDSTQFGIGWSALIPNLPPVTVQYTQLSSSNSIFGTDQKDTSISRNFNLQSNYHLAGWWLTGRFADSYTRAEIPEFLAAGESNVNDGNSTTFNINATRPLPLRGSTAFSYNHTAFTGNGGVAHFSGSNETILANASFLPWTRFSTQFAMEYNSNLSGDVEQQLISAGSVAPQVNLGSGSHSLSFNNADTLYILHNLSVSFNFNRIQQEVYGASVSADHYSAIANYRFQKPLFGSLLVYGGVNDQAADGVNQGAGLVAGVNLSRYIRGWDLSGSVGYSQDVQTVLATTTTSNYSYLASVNRFLGRRTHWYTSFSGFHTGASLVPGSSAHTESYSTSILYRALSVAANYNTSSGTALVTPTGLVTAPGTIPVSLLGPNQYLISGSSYGLSGSASPFRKMILSGNYTHAQNLTTSPSLKSANSSNIVSLYAQYQLRKLQLVGGYTHLTQAVGASGTLPANYSTYYIGIQRWFKPF